MLRSSPKPGLDSFPFPFHPLPLCRSYWSWTEKRKRAFLYKKRKPRVVNSHFSTLKHQTIFLQTFFFVVPCVPPNWEKKQVTSISDNKSPSGSFYYKDDNLSANVKLRENLKSKYIQRKAQRCGIHRLTEKPENRADITKGMKNRLNGIEVSSEFFDESCGLIRIWVSGVKSERKKEGEMRCVCVCRDGNN